MSKGINIDNFIDACEASLGRAEGVINQPLKLQVELEGLDKLLRNEWPTAILDLKERKLSPEDREKIKIIFRKIKKLEMNTGSRISLYNGIEDFMREPRNR